MSTATQQTEQPTVAKKGLELPRWSVALLVLLVAGGAGYAGYRFWTGGHPGAGKEIDIGNTGFFGGRQMGANPRRLQAQMQTDPATLPDGVHAGAMNLSWVRMGDFYTSLPNDPASSMTIRVFYAKPDLLTAEEQSILQARRRLPTDAALAKQFNVTPEQSKALVAIPLGIGAGLRVTPEDRDRIKAAWQVYVGAADSAKDAAKTALLTTLKQVGDKSLEPTRAQQRERVEQIRKVLTPEQIAEWRAKGL